ncbi:uncharacterized protein J7T54_000211 [Emericellopsis cladophorae]|uniref:Uncharacterized protein n=1 Tax=Emericellopsis cladophorae TaxID=2686198 RepID=A0A9P9XZL0_9HYPO|nr:uncharacterized protein J7T54_000211 [Emericellopsis cladophorae]KAI6780571.1 hypothetical protein J7T54_000211 [Emericellopsis cladophorae]
MFNDTHLELLHHFTTVTYNTLTAHPTLKVMWRITVPQLGLKHPFLMRSIFAIASLNLAVLRPQRRSFYVDVSREEHSAALAMAVPLISNATEDNASALFAFSMLAVIYILAAPREPGDHWLLVSKGGLTDWLALIQGTRSVSTIYQEHLSKGPVSPLFTVSHAHVKNAEEKGQALPAWKGSSEYRQMMLLRQLIRGRVEDAQRLSQYETLLDLLEQSFAANMASPISYCQETLSDDREQVATSHIFSFLYRSLEIMQGPLQAREPEALVIFAYYCVLLHNLESYWWIQTLPRDIMEEIWGALNYEYRYWIQWPAEQLGWAPRDS